MASESWNSAANTRNCTARLITAGSDEYKAAMSWRRTYKVNADTKLKATAERTLIQLYCRASWERVAPTSKPTRMVAPIEMLSGSMYQSEVKSMGIWCAAMVMM